MNKKTKEPVYRDTNKGERWRFIKASIGPWGTPTGSWLMTRVRDGYRAYWPADKMKLEKLS